MKKALLLICLFILSSSIAYSQPQKNSNELFEKFKQNRTYIYSRLDLTTAQKQQITVMDKKLYTKLEPELNKITISVNKIKELANSGNCTIEQVNEVKKEFKATDKKITTLKSSYEKEFLTILTPEQKTKYKIAKKQRRIELKQQMEEIKKTHKK